jgi:hypothetical protein
MEQQSSSLRERLLARLPQPENLAGYREETASLLAKHERALYWEKVMARTLTGMGVGFFIMARSTWGQKLYTNGTVVLDVIAVLLFFAAINEFGYRVSRSKVDLLKEVKQVQLQILELQASLRKDGDQ